MTKTKGDDGEEWRRYRVASRNGAYEVLRGLHFVVDDIVYHYGQYSLNRDGTMSPRVVARTMFQLFDDDAGNYPSYAFDDEGYLTWGTETPDAYSCTFPKRDAKGRFMKREEKKDESG